MDLPTELLREIIGYLSVSLPDLARCARVNRAIGGSALAILYRDVNLCRFDDDGGEEGWERSEK